MAKFEDEGLCALAEYIVDANFEFTQKERMQNLINDTNDIIKSLLQYLNKWKQRASSL